MFQPVEGEIDVVKKQVAKTKRGQRLLEASKVDNKLIQDRASTKVVVGADVEALYPSLEDVQVADIVYQAVMETEVGFEGVHWQEGARYIALNSTAQECRVSPLSRILPTRRKTTGTRPGITGEGPMGPGVGDQNQWKFPDVRLTKLERRMVVAEVMRIATLVLFRTHVYEFGNKYFLQRRGGPIGLRSTCCIARLVMLWWDRRLMEMVAESNMSVEEKARYMDDIRLWTFCIRLGWRWSEGSLKFSREWRNAEMDAGMTGLQKTLEVFQMMMNDVCSFLKLTMESVDDYGGRLPTLDLTIWVREDNKTMYLFYEKPMASNMVIQKKSAMPENMKIATLNQEVVRRMMNTSEELDMGERCQVLDNYCQKMSNSGYEVKQMRHIVIGGLTGYERRLQLSKNKTNPKWRPLHEGAHFNVVGRRKKKMLAKSEWFKKKRENDDLVESPGKKASLDDQTVETGNVSNAGPCTQSWGQTKSESGHASKIRLGAKIKTSLQKRDPDTLTVMFLEQTVGGVLAKRLQEAEDRLGQMTGYRVRMVEMAGTQLSRLLPCTNPWGGGDCKRGDCFTCNQGGEKLENCRKRNVLYESMCTVCNPGMEDSKMDTGNNTIKAVYVGETSRSVYERAGEHARDAREGKPDSHRVKHWQLAHMDLPEPPTFRVKVVGQFQDALSRQIAESVRIDIRGDEGLNSRTEYSRCRHPRLRIGTSESGKIMEKEEMWERP